MIVLCTNNLKQNKMKTTSNEWPYIGSMKVRIIVSVMFLFAAGFALAANHIWPFIGLVFLSCGIMSTLIPRNETKRRNQTDTDRGL